MTNTKIKTDNHSFVEFLKTLDHNSLVEHARENLLCEVISDILLKNTHLHNNALELFFHRKMKLSPELSKTLLKGELKKADEEEIIDAMVQLFSKKLLIDSLLEYTDEGTRQDIIDNQVTWNQQFKYQINYN